MVPADPANKPAIYVDSTESLEQTMHALIPISKAMEITVDGYSGDSLVLSAPLAPNINHQQSAFGGSLFAVAALAGWGLMQLKLSELNLDCNTVVMGGDVSYQRPVFEDLRCTCRLPDDIETVFATLTDTGKASLHLEASFEAGGKPAMTLSGHYHLRLKTD